MRLLIGGSASKIFHLNEFASSLAGRGIECKVVQDRHYASRWLGFRGKKISAFFEPGEDLGRLLHDFDPDVVMVDGQTEFGLRAIHEGIPLFMHLRGDYWSEAVMARNTIYRSLHRRAILSVRQMVANRGFRNATLILPICRYLEQIVNRRFPNTDSSVWYQGIDPDRWHTDSAGMDLKHPCVGLLQNASIWGKTQEMLVLKKVMKRMPDVTFYWAGDGIYRDRILPELEAFDNFKWLGALDYPDGARRYLSEIDVYALLTGLDMSPLTLQEAQLLQRPVVASRVGGVPELMADGKTGFLADPGDADQLVAKIRTLLDDRTGAEQMGRDGREFVRSNFGWDAVTGQFMDLIRRHA